METNIYKIDPWEIIEEGWDPVKVMGSESIFSIGNGAMVKEPILRKITVVKLLKAVI